MVGHRVHYGQGRLENGADGSQKIVRAVKSTSLSLREPEVRQGAKSTIMTSTRRELENILVTPLEKDQ